jgi:glycogen debranching enzyme
MSLGTSDPGHGLGRNARVRSRPSRALPRRSLLDEYERWTGDSELVHTLELPARRALEWIDNYGDADGDGYVEYQTRNPDSGLVNHCWKDSWNSILFADGTLAEGPIATCEIQGYVYDAKCRSARLAREVWEDEDLAERLEAEAQALRAHFLEDFWIEAKRCFALALDGEKRQVDSIASNIGHLLWSGILDEAGAPAVTEHLMSDAMYSGWGVRTMAGDQGGYNPVEYHNGTVWPHDNSLIARSAPVWLRHRGCPDHRVRPQAWAAGAPLLLLCTTLGLQPGEAGLSEDPDLPASFGNVALRDIPGRWGRADVEATASSAVSSLPG